MAVHLNHLNLRVRDVQACRDFYVHYFAFSPAFEAEGGYFLRDEAGFLLALLPAVEPARLPEGTHIGFGARTPEDVSRKHADLAAAGVRVSDVEDFRPDEDYTSMRCWDPDGTEIEVFWDGT